VLLSLLTMTTSFLYGGPKELLMLSWLALQKNVNEVPSVEKVKGDGIITYMVKNIQNPKEDPQYITFTLEVTNGGRRKKKSVEKLVLVGHEELDGKEITEKYEITGDDEQLFLIVGDLYRRLLYLYRVQGVPEGGKLKIDMLGLSSIWAMK